jgi:Tetratricopeptide repeat
MGDRSVALCDRSATLRDRSATLRDRHPTVASSLNTLALLYYAQGRYQEAEPFLGETVQRFADLLGENHPNSKIVRKNFELFLKEALAQLSAGIAQQPHRRNFRAFPAPKPLNIHPNPFKI